MTWQTILRRVETIIATLRDPRYSNSPFSGGPGWIVDEGGAEECLSFFRRKAAGGREMAREAEAATRFLSQYGVLDFAYCADVPTMTMILANNSRAAWHRNAVIATRREFTVIDGDQAS
jgi:hypothetical protein